MELAGKVALVTGASKGIGRAYVLALAQAGATAVAVARTMGTPKPGTAPAKGTLAEVVQAAAAKKLKIHAIACDLEREDDIKRTVDEIVTNYGRIDVVINNAAMFPHYETLDITVEEWQQNLNINLLGPYLLTRHVAPYMMAQRSGSIVNITSAVARPTEFGSAGHTGLMPYCVTKAALDRMTHFFSEDLRAHNVAVNALSPGMVLTDTWLTVAPQDAAAAEKAGYARHPTPEALGPAVVCLAQQTAATLTGQILHTNDYGKTWPKAA